MTAAPSAWRTGRVVAAGIELARFSAGSERAGAPVILLLHGLGHWTSGAWDRLLPEFDPAWRVEAVDLPGFGASAKPDTRYDAAFFRRVIAELAEQLPARFALCGHSLGGAIAADFAGAFPERVSHLALIAPAGLARSRRLLVRALAAQLLQHAARLPVPPALVRHTARRAFVDPAALDSRVEARALALVSDPRFRRSLLRVWAAALPTFSARRAPDSWSHFTGPVFVAWGRHDRYVSIVPPDVLARVYPQALQLVLERSAHLPMVEEPDVLGAALRPFFATPPAGLPISHLHVVDLAFEDDRPRCEDR
jgi:pimeloyl-ACP methyl ester carboxylesterase